MRKDTLKLHISKTFIALGCVSMVAESCTSYYPVSSEDFAKDDDEGAALLPLDVYVPESVSLSGIASFSRDIINDTGLLERFYKNPAQTLESYGISYFDKDSTQIQMLLASADPDVLSCISNGDFRGYLNVLKEKNYLQSDVVKQLQQALNNPTSDMDSPTSLGEGESLIVIGAVLILVVAAVGILAAVTTVVYTSVEIAGSEDESEPEDSAINLYIDKSKSIGTLDMSETDYVSHVRKIIEGLNITANGETMERLFQLCLGTANHFITNLENK